MSKSFRTAVFVVLVLAFFVLGSGIVLYAQGWRASFLPLDISKVGGMYLRTYPEDANVFLDGELLKHNSGLFDRGILAPNLFPKPYEIRIEKAGYKSWTSTLTVEPS